ncbi:acetyl-CoA carboxylase, carboxyl transferase, beta subunit [Chloroherpeton thalassium ATCC 35110]|uniref:Acetyl-coenzyme A carboxylase carboxyl transferase subunit beta n=1 Tax=Chloroherpeton thalassium (strain ATCC 35110 / GB-78) TaxID=517418 RepID=B3QRT5_CHLT3|nr:acetyl-CoA carboxylase, carboxyltransferase subunit beta [Chloroherpeton thalassium]ACF13888.1 acetyl-CoA carboxylase, carboxyl transferase, beta subunit [Chloroherpeton thalassium ATCC 35110]
MSWFKRVKPAITTEQKRDVPEGLWWKCEKCGAMLHRKQLEDNLFTCPECDNHFRISPERYFQILFDEKRFEEFEAHLRSADPLGFVDTKRYVDRIQSTMEKTGKTDACRNAIGHIGGHHVVVSAMDFGFIGGSMGSVVGEKISRAIDKSLAEEAPFIMISQSGGARMMEAALSLMQMAKTSAKLTLLHEKGIPYISLMTDPTTGGVTASFAMLGDFNLAEPNAYIGFAGQRVIKETIRKDLPEGFQRAEFLREHGFIDFIVHRVELKAKVEQLLNLLKG